MRTLSATYRLQLGSAFPLASARQLVPYLDRLGVSHVYLSPVLAARAGSKHGYDVIDHARVNPELGSESDLRALAGDLHARGMGIILDIVPNHMSASEANPYWDDVLQRGRSSRYAEWFDIDWDVPHADGKVVLPALGDELDAVLERGELKLHVRESGSRVAYADRTFPLDAATLPKEATLAQWDPAGRPALDEWQAGPEGRERLRALLEAQHYRLTFWRCVDAINYRRFFDINDLVALRMETDAIFDATHALVLSWIRDGVVDGLRIDHIDGLRVPSWYLARLRDAVDSARHPDAPARVPIFVEKILSGDERLPTEWPVDGSTGYDFMNEVEELFIDQGGMEAIEANYRGLRHNPSLEFREVAREGKRRALNGPLTPDVMRVARVAHRWCGAADAPTLEQIATAIVELIVHLDVYRTYVTEPGLVRDDDRAVLDRAVAEARNRAELLPQALDLLARAFFDPPNAGDVLRAELVTRLQQTSGPATAKGVEDTALYVYVPLASRNEVGGAPHQIKHDAHAFLHARNQSRRADWPLTLLATNTHDTKRSADLRSRLDVLSARSTEWSRHVSRWRKLNKARKRTVHGRPAPDTNTEYLYYQTLLGLWPAPRRERRVDDLPDRAWLERAAERLNAFVLKAAREAKTRTSWTDLDTQYETALAAFVRETMDPHPDAPFLPDVARLTAAIASDGFRNALARLVVHCTAPGVPDLYQGDELWTFTLVDPDNRRPVDFELRQRLLNEATADELLRAAWTGEIALSDDRVKLALTTILLRFRREHAALFQRGDYVVLPSEGGIFAFERRLPDQASLTIVRTSGAPPGIENRGSKEPPFSGELVGAWRSVLTGRESYVDRPDRTADTVLRDLLGEQPCDLLLR